MYVLPMSIEIFAEQQRILQKIQAQMMHDPIMGDSGPQIRPF